MRATSIAAALDYINRHDDHFGYGPAAIEGSPELYDEMQKVIVLHGYKSTYSPDSLCGVPILWPDEDLEVVDE